VLRDLRIIAHHLGRHLVAGARVAPRNSRRRRWKPPRLTDITYGRPWPFARGRKENAFVSHASPRGGPERRFRFGIVGCGSIGPTHAGAIQQIAGAQLVAVADPVPERARAVADKFNVAKVYARDAELYADPDVDVVCLCTPSGMHADGAVAALRAGKHVIVEKPMEVSLAACDRMIAAADETGRKLTVISQHRWDAASQMARKEIAAGALGRLVLCTADVKWWRTQEYYDSGDWRGTWKLDGGGALMNQGVHTVDVLQWLAGPVRQITAHTRTAAHENIEVEDVAVATLIFESGAVGTLVATTAAYPGLPVRLDFFGTQGSLTIEGDRLKQFATRDGKRITGEEAAAHAVSVAQGGTASVKDQAATRLAVDGQSATAATAASDPGAVWGDAHRAQIEDFLDAIRTNRDPLITPRAARRPVEIILAVYESAKSGKPVTLKA
jgi:predicted dehydrogenase